MTTRPRSELGLGTPVRASAPLLVLAASLLVIAVAVEGSLPLVEIAFLVTAGVTLALAHRAILSWPTLLCGIVLVILFVPIRRYTIPVNLPFELEPYRILVAFIVAGWLASLLVDPAVRLRRSGFEGPIALIVAAVLGSVIANPGRVSSLSTDVIKDITFLASFLLLFYLMVSVVTSWRFIDVISRALVLGGSVVATIALIESRTGWNPFNQLAGVVPFLQNAAIPEQETRGGRLRVFASAQHPIALGAAFVVLLPLAVYLARRTGRRAWWAAAVIIGMGAFATVSRTSIVMLAVAGVVIAYLRPSQAKRLLIPALVVLPLLVHLALPGTLGTLKKSFFPEGGLIADQQKSAGSAGSGRVSDLGPAFSELSKSPFVGQGYGTRITDSERSNAQILDNQWLKTLLETGVLGFVGWFWFLIAIIRRLGRAAKEDESERGWLFVATCASITAFAVGMFTFDAFSFIQATFLLFILLGLGACALRLRAVESPASAPSAVRSGRDEPLTS